jgi:ABC-2 type transport system ATP-binding protein
LAELAIRCVGLEKHYRDVTAVAGLDLEIRAGECFGLLGPNGAGKTTTMEILEGLTQPDAGVVELLGHAWTKGDARLLRQKIGVALQETRLPEKLTVWEVIRLFRTFYPAGREVEEVVALLDLGDKAKSLVGKLSGGQRQRLALACALVGAPEILFLDEPTTGLDPQARHHIWEVVSRFRQAGGTVLITTHYMDEAQRLCDRVAVMDHGRCIALGTPAELVGVLGAEHVVELRTTPQVSAELLLNARGVLKASELAGSLMLTVERLEETIPAILDTLRAAAVTVDSLSVHSASLEDVFISLTGRGLRDE